MYFRNYGLQKPKKYLKSAISQVPLEKQHGKRSQTLFKSKWWHLYHIY